jgi:hypothetical protein
MKSITKLSVILCAAAACVAWPVLAQTSTTPPATNTAPATRPPRAGNPTYRGTISTIDAASMTLTLKARTNEFKVKVTSTTKVFKDNAPAQFSDITTGLRVSGQGKKADDGSWTATTLRATTAPQPKAPAAAKPQ